MTSLKGDSHTIIGYYNDDTPAYFDYICDGLYDYSQDNGYYNLGSWIEKAARKKGK